jgi:hypothetical protein
MKKSELKAIIKRELLKEGFDGFNGVISLGATNRMTSLTEMEDEMVYSGAMPIVSDKDMAIVIEDALNNIYDTGISIEENAREVLEILTNDKWKDSVTKAIANRAY